MLLKGFNPNFKYVSRTTMRKYCLIIYDEYKQKLIFEISKGSFKISLTSDILTFQNNSDYLCELLIILIIIRLCKIVF